MPLPKLKYIVAPSVDFVSKQSYLRPEEEDPSKFVLPMPQSIRVNLVFRGALLVSLKLQNLKELSFFGKMLFAYQTKGENLAIKTLF